MAAAASGQHRGLGDRRRRGRRPRHARGRVQRPGLGDSVVHDQTGCSSAPKASSPRLGIARHRPPGAARDGPAARERALQLHWSAAVDGFSLSPTRRWRGPGSPARRRCQARPPSRARRPGRPPAPRPVARVRRLPGPAVRPGTVGARVGAAASWLQARQPGRRSWIDAAAGAGLRASRRPIAPRLLPPPRHPGQLRAGPGIPPGRGAHRRTPARARAGPILDVDCCDAFAAGVRRAATPGTVSSA